MENYGTRSIMVQLLSEAHIGHALGSGFVQSIFSSPPRRPPLEYLPSASRRGADLKMLCIMSDPTETRILTASITRQWKTQADFTYWNLTEMERGENANGQKFGQVRDPSRRLNFQQDLPELQDQLF